LQKYLAWKHIWHTETGKLSPSFKPKESLEYKAWLKTVIEANPACQLDGSDDEKEAWRKKESCVPARRIGREKGLTQKESCVPARRNGREGGLAQKFAGRASEDIDEKNC